MKIKMKAMAAVIAVVIFGGIGITMAMQLWSTESSKEPIAYSEGDFAGEYNPEDIRGSYTFADVASLFEIETSVLMDAFGFPLDTPGETVKNKDLEGYYEELPYEIGNGSVKLFVALYKGLPYVLEDDYLPARAVEILKESGAVLTDEQREYVEIHQVALNGIDLEEVPEDISEEILEEEEPIINGPTTFQQLLDAGLSVAQIEEALGMSMPATNMVVKDFCTENGISFSSVKTAIEAMATE